MSYRNLGTIKGRLFVMMLTAVVCFAMICDTAGFAFATSGMVKLTDDDYAGKTGIVTTTALNVRQGPGTEYRSIGKLSMGNEILINGSARDKEGVLWYKFVFNGTDGYSSSEYISVKREVPYDYSGDFEAYMTAQGFPESYKPYLRNLHAAYPNWVFKSAQTNVDWDYVIEKESRVGVSLIGIGSPASWKSTAPGAYNPATGEYITFDSGGWVTASKALVEYYVDPRNFLNDVGIFQFLGHGYDGDTQKKDGLKQVVSGSFMSGAFPESTYSTYVDALMDIGKKSGVNPYVLASMIILEQGKQGQGGSISGKQPGYEGYYNFFNINAYRTSTLTAVQNGLKYAQGSGSYERPWNTRAKSMSGGATFYGEKYVRKNQYNQYLKKFNVMNGAEAVATRQYMTNVAGAEHEASILRNGYVSILSNPMTFVIPVYKNMPSISFPKPGSVGDNNFYLSKLSVDGHQITPEFNLHVNKYELVVGHDVESVNISATPSNAKATVTGAGTVKLPEKDNEVRVVVRSTSGNTNTYIIMISKEDSPAADPGEGDGSDDKPKPDDPEDGNVDEETSVSSDKYVFGDYLTGLSEKTEIADFVKNIEVKNGAYSILNKDNAEVKSGFVGTGMKFVLYDKDKKALKEYAIVVKGDVSGDGLINSLDTLLAEKHVVQVKLLEGVFFKASDANGDGKINSVDTLIIEKHVVNIATITP